MSEPIKPTINPGYIQLSRRKGFDLQKLSLSFNGLPAVNCARPSKWGNPFRVGIEARDAAHAVKRYRETGCGGIGHDEIKRELRGKNLACFCKQGAPCHVQDVLLPIANS
jgi:hypothetical protein